MVYSVSLVTSVGIPSTAESNIIPLQVSEVADDEDFLAETPLAKEIQKAFIHKIIDACCILRPELVIDKSIVINCLKTCINEELCSKKFSSRLNLRDLFFLVANTHAALEVESFTFGGSSVVFKLADAIIRSLEASKASLILTDLFISNLKRTPHDSDWKVVIQNPPKDSMISFWDNVEAYTRAIIRKIALEVSNRKLEDTFDIPAECLLLGIEYEAVQGKYIHLIFKESGIDLDIGRFDNGGLFSDTLPEVTLKSKSITENPDDLEAELHDEEVSIFQAGVFRGYKVANVINPESKNDRASVQLIRRSLSGDVSLQEDVYPIFLKNLFKAYPVNAAWGKAIGRKFCNINKSHSHEPFEKIFWGLLLFLSNLKKYPQYLVTDTLKEEVWEHLPVWLGKDHKSIEQLNQSRLYQLIHSNRLSSDVLEAIIGIAGLLHLCCTTECSSGPFRLTRHYGRYSIALCYMVKDDLQIMLKADLQVFCESLKIHYADNAIYAGSPLSHDLLKYFIDLVPIDKAIDRTSVIGRNASRLPCSYSTIAELAHSFILKLDPFLNMMGVAILICLKEYKPEYIDESLLCYAFPLLLSSTDEKTGAIAALLARKYLSVLGLKDNTPFLHPKTNAFSMAHWLNALALSHHPRCCEIATKHWAMNIPPLKENFQAYLAFMDNIWKAQPILLMTVLESMVPLSFDVLQQRKLIKAYIEKFLALPDCHLATECLKPFIHVVNACLPGLSSGDDRLTELLKKVSKLRPLLIPLCASWLPFISIEAVPFLQIGSIEDIIQQKILSAETPDEKKDLCTFIQKNIHLKGLYFTILSSSFFKVFSETNYPIEIHTKFIREPSQCDLQKGRILLRLLTPETILDLKNDINSILLKLINSKVTPVALLLRLFDKCYSLSPISAIDHLWKPLCLFTTLLINLRLVSMQPLAGFFCKHSPLQMKQEKELLISLLKCLIFEDTQNAFTTAMELAEILRIIASPFLSTWENLIPALRLAAYHHDTVQNISKLKEFSSRFPELITLCHQLDLDLLAAEIEPFSPQCSERAEKLIARRKELTGQQQNQLKLIFQRMIDCKVSRSPSQALAWIKSPFGIEAIQEQTRISYYCEIVQKKFDEEVCKVILDYLKDSKAKNNPAIIKFVSFFVQSAFIFTGCNNAVQRSQRLVSLSDFSRPALVSYCENILIELIEAKELELLLTLFEKVLSSEKFTPQISKSLKSLSGLIPQKHFENHKRLLNIACNCSNELDLELWDTFIEKSFLQKDLSLRTKVLVAWISHFPFPSYEKITLLTTKELDVHFKVIIGLIPEHLTIATPYFQEPRSMLHLLSLHSPHARRAEILSSIAISLIKNESQDWSSLIQEILLELKEHEDFSWVLRPALFLLEKELKSNNFIIVTKELTSLLNKCNLLSQVELKHYFSSQVRLLTSFFSLLLSSNIPNDNSLNKELIQFFAKLRDVVPPDEILWLSILKWIVRVTEKDFSLISIQSSPEIVSGVLSSSRTNVSFFFLTHIILKSFRKSFSNSLKEQYSTFFNTKEFGIFFVELTRVSTLGKTLEQFVALCKEERLIVENTAQHFFYLIVFHAYKQALTHRNPSPPSFFGAFETYKRNLPYFFINKEFDDKCAEVAIQGLLELIKMKANIKKLDMKIVMLIAYCFTDVSKKSLLNVETFIKNDSETHLFSFYEIYRTPYENARVILHKIKLAKALYSSAQNLTENEYNIIIKGMALCLLSILKRHSAFPLSMEELEEVKKLTKQFILFPRHNNYTSTLTHFEYSYLFIEHAKKANLFDDNTLGALELYVRVNHSDYSIDLKSFPDIIEVLFTLLCEESKYSFISFMEDVSLRLKNYAHKASLSECITLFTLVINACRKSLFPPTLRFILFKKIFEQMEGSDFLPPVPCNGLCQKIPYKIYNDEARLIHIDFLYIFLKGFIEQSEEMCKLNRNKRSKELREFFKDYQHTVNLDKLDLIHEDGNCHTMVLLLVNGMLNSVAFNFEIETNFNIFWSKHFEIITVLISFYNDTQLKFFPPIKSFLTETFLEISLFQPNSKWLQHGDPHILDLQKKISSQAVQIALTINYDEESNIQLIKQKVSKITYLNSPELFYRYFSSTNHKLIPLLYIEEESDQLKALQATVETARALLSEQKQIQEARFSLFHSCYFASSLSFSSQDLDSLRQLVRQALGMRILSSHWDEVYCIFSVAIRTLILCPDNHKDQLLLIEVLKALLEQHKKYFRKALESAVKLRWFQKELLVKEKEQILVHYFTSIIPIPPDTSVLSPLAGLIREYLLRMCLENSFEKNEWIVLLTQEILPADESSLVWISAALFAFKNKKHSIAAFFIAKVTSQKYLNANSELIRCVFVGFFLNIPRLIEYINTINLILHSPALALTANTHPEPLRKSLFLFFKKHFKTLISSRFPHTLLLLEHYTKALSSELKQSKTLPQNIEKNFLILTRILNVLYPLKPEDAWKWIKSFIDALVDNADAELIPELILHFLLACKNQPHLSKLSLIPALQFYELVQRFSNETSSKTACDLLTDLGWLYPAVDHVTQKEMAMCCLSSVQLALSEGHIDTAHNVIKAYKEYLEGCFNVSYSDKEYTPMLLSIIGILFYDQHFKQAAIYVKILLQFASRDTCQNHFLGLFEVAYKAEEYVLAGQIMLWTKHLDLPFVKEFVAKVYAAGAVTQEKFNILIDIYKTYYLIDRHYLNILADFLGKDIDLSNTLLLINFLEHVEEVEKLTEIDLLLPLWIVVLKSLHKFKEGYHLKLLHAGKGIIIRKKDTSGFGTLNALLILAVLRSSDPLAAKVIFFWASRLEISKEEDELPEVQEADKQFKIILQNLPASKVKLYLRCILFLAKIDQNKLKKISESARISEIIEVIISGVLRHFALFPDNFDEALRTIIPLMRISHRFFILAKLLETKNPSLTPISLHYLHNNPEALKRVPLEALKHTLERLHCHTNENVHKAIREIDDVLLKIGHMLSPKDKIEIYTGVIKKYFENIPAQSFVIDFSIYLDWVKNVFARVFRDINQASSLVSDLCLLYAFKIGENKELIEYIPAFISETSLVFYSNKPKSQQNIPSAIFNAKNGFMFIENGGYFAMMYYLTQSMRTVPYPENLEALRFILTSQAQNQKLVTVKNVSINCDIFLECVLALFDPFLLNALEGILIPLMTAEPFHSLLKKNPHHYFQLCLILSQGKIKTHSLVKNYNFNLSSDESNSCVINLAKSILKSPLSAEVYLLLATLMNYQKETKRFSVNHEAIYKLMDELILSYNTKNFYEPYTPGSIIFLFDCMEVFLNKDSKEFIPLQKNTLEIFDELSQSKQISLSECLLEVALLKIMLITWPKGRTYQTNNLVFKEQIKRYVIELNAALKLTSSKPDELTHSYMEYCIKAIKVTFNNLQDPHFAQELLTALFKDLPEQINSSLPTNTPPCQPPPLL